MNTQQHHYGKALLTIYKFLAAAGFFCRQHSNVIG